MTIIMVVDFSSSTGEVALGQVGVVGVEAMMAGVVTPGVVVVDRGAVAHGEVVQVVAQVADVEVAVGVVIELSSIHIIRAVET